MYNHVSVKEACSQAATIQNAVSGFAKTGIWALDSTNIQDSDFVPTVSRVKLESRDVV